MKTVSRVSPSNSGRHGRLLALLLLSALCLPPRACGQQLARDRYAADLCQSVSGSVDQLRSGLFIFGGNTSACSAAQRQLQAPVAYRVTMISNHSDKVYPLVMSVRQTSSGELLRWSIPYEADGFSRVLFLNISETLCPDFDAPVPAETDENVVTVDVVTNNNSTVDFEILVEPVAMFEMTLGERQTLTFGPGSPEIRYMAVPEADRSGVLRVNVESEDDNCVLVTVQAAVCPIRSPSRAVNIASRELFQTMTGSATTVFRSNTFSHRFFLLLQSLDNSVCDKLSTKPLPQPTVPAGIVTSAQVDSLSKNVTITVTTQAPVADFGSYIFFPIGLFLIAAMATIPITVMFSPYWRAPEWLRNKWPNGSRRLKVVFDAVFSKSLGDYLKLCCGCSGRDSPANGEVAMSGNTRTDVSKEVEAEKETEMKDGGVGDGAQVEDDGESGGVGNGTDGGGSGVEGAVGGNGVRRRGRGEGEGEEEGEEEEDGDVHEGDGYLCSLCPTCCTDDHLCVDGLFKRSYKLLTERYNVYLWISITVFVFYVIPAFQVLLAVSDELAETGNLDVCYFNFKCAHPVSLPLIGDLAAFNNIWSNIMYALLGLIFIVVVWIRDKRHRLRVKKKDYDADDERKATLGVPPLPGVLYAMGFALMSEGVMSAIYHICPTTRNIQFDTTFMFIIGGLMLIKVFQSRHPDKTAKAHIAFLLFSFIIFLALIGIYQDDRNPIAVRIVLFSCILAILLTFLNSFYHYHSIWTVEGRKQLWKEIKCLKITNVKRFTLFAINFTSNVIIAILLVISGGLNGSPSFSLCFLAFYLFNVTYFLALYWLQKVCYKERTVVLLPHLYLFLAVVLIVVALYYFISSVYEATVSPSESRTINEDCILGSFYDSHDVWHFLSALGLYFFMLFILTIDDGVARVRHDKLRAF